MFSKLFEGHKDLDCIEGTNLFHSFNVIKPIGKGNNQVFLVEHRDTFQRLAMKEIVKYLFCKNIKQVIQSTYELNEVVKKEIQLLKTLNNHPHIIQFHDYCILIQKLNEFTTSMQAYILMELAEHGSLDQLVRQGNTYIPQNYFKIQNYQQSKRKFESHQIIHFIDQAFEAFCYLQTCNVAHCDIKPENILISDIDSFTIKICDIGSAKHLTSSYKLNNHQQGTVAFMSPEFVRYLSDTSNQINFFISDVFSFGLVLLNLCTFQKFHTHERAAYINDDQQFSIRLDEMINSVSKFDEIWGQNQMIRKILIQMIEVDQQNRLDFRQLNEKWGQLKLEQSQQSLKLQLSKLNDEILGFDIKSSYVQKEEKKKDNSSQSRIKRRLQNINIKKTELKINQNKLEDSYQLLDVSEYNSNSEAAQFGLLILSQRFSTAKHCDSIDENNSKIERPSFSINKIQHKAPSILVRNGSSQKQVSNSTQINRVIYNKKNGNEQKKLPQLTLKQLPPKQKQGFNIGKLKKLLQDQLNSNEFSDNQFKEQSSLQRESFFGNKQKINSKNYIKLQPLMKIT